MRKCYSCNSESNLNKILNINLSLIDDIKINNEIIVMYCNKCNNYFNGSENLQEYYDAYYKSYFKYSDESIKSDKNIKCVDYLLNNLKNLNINSILNYGSGDNIISNILSKSYKTDNYDIYMEDNINKYDFIILSHVLEHIYDLNNFFIKIINNLNEDGYIYIEIPNAEYYYEMKDFCPLQEINLEHINFFSKYSLSKLMINHNFIPINIVDDYFNLLNRKYYVIRGIFKLNNNNKSFENYIKYGLEKLNKINFKNLENLYIYGCGEFLYKILNKIINCKILNIVDDNETYLNKKINNIEIINFEILKKKVNDNDNILISTILNSNKIKEKLKILNKKINLIEIDI